MKLRSLLRRTGFDVTRYPPANSLASDLRRALAFWPVDGALDVGAHHGGFVRLLRDVVGYSGPVVSFEPMRASFEVLQRDRIGDAAWSGRRIGIGASAGKMALNVAAGTDLNSFREANGFGRARFAELAGRGVEEVGVKRLDEVVDLPGRLLLKSDTQGYELAVLEGSAGLLDRVDVLVVEISVQAIYKGTPSMVETLMAILDLGFHSAGMSAVTYDGARVIEYDGVFVR